MANNDDDAKVIHNFIRSFKILFIGYENDTRKH